MIGLTARQARRFLLLHHGLLGPHRFAGKDGALAFVRQAGCIQFDPVNVCGRNAELTLQSRVKGFTRNTLDALLYEDRADRLSRQEPRHPAGRGLAVHGALPRPSAGMRHAV